LPNDRLSRIVALATVPNQKRLRDPIVLARRRGEIDTTKLIRHGASGHRQRPKSCKRRSPAKELGFQPGTAIRVKAEAAPARQSSAIGLAVRRFQAPS
jgi:hypothetical protein